MYWWGVALETWYGLQAAETAEACERALVHAERAGAVRLASRRFVDRMLRHVLTRPDSGRTRRSSGSRQSASCRSGPLAEAWRAIVLGRLSRRCRVRSNERASSFAAPDRRTSTPAALERRRDKPRRGRGRVPGGRPRGRGARSCARASRCSSESATAAYTATVVARPCRVPLPRRGRRRRDRRAVRESARERTCGGRSVNFV